MSKHPPLPFEQGFHHPIDGNDLIVAKMLLGLVVAGREQLPGGLVVHELPSLTQPAPQFIGRWKRLDLLFQTGQEVELDDLLAVSGIGELEIEDFGVFLGLLEPLASRLVAGLRLHDGDGEVTGIAEPIVGPFLRAAPNPSAPWE